MQTYTLYNPYDDIDHKIRNDFLKFYSLELNGLHYNTYGIIDDFYLLNLIGDSKIFNVFLGYKNGVFAAVKIMKRSVYDSKDILSERIRAFHYELEIRNTLKEYECFPTLYHVNREKYIIYEEYCNNGNLACFAKTDFKEKTVKATISKIASVMNILKSHGLEHTNLNSENVIYDRDFNIKIIGFRQIQKRLLFEGIFSSESEFVQVDYHVRSLLILLREIYLKKGSKFQSLMNSSIVDKSAFGEEFDVVLAENNLSFQNESLIEFIYTIKLLNSLDFVEELDWLKVIIPKDEYIYDMYDKRPIALQAFYSCLFMKEEKLLAKKKGLFKVVK